MAPWTVGKHNEAAGVHTLLGGAAAWPLVARAQQVERMRRIGVLMTVTAEDTQMHRVTAFVQTLAQSGWTQATVGIWPADVGGRDCENDNFSTNTNIDLDQNGTSMNAFVVSASSSAVPN